MWHWIFIRLFVYQLLNTQLIAKLSKCFTVESQVTYIFDKSVRQKIILAYKMNVSQSVSQSVSHVFLQKRSWLRAVSTHTRTHSHTHTHTHRHTHSHTHTNTHTNWTDTWSVGSPTCFSGNSWPWRTGTWLKGTRRVTSRLPEACDSVTQLEQQQNLGWMRNLLLQIFLFYTPEVSPLELTMSDFKCIYYKNHHLGENVSVS